MVLPRELYKVRNETTEKYRQERQHKEMRHCFVDITGKKSFKQSSKEKLSVTFGLFIGSSEIKGSQKNAQKNLFKCITSVL